MKATEKDKATFENREGDCALLQLASQKYPGSAKLISTEQNLKLGGSEAATWVALTYSSNRAAALEVNTNPL